MAINKETARAEQIKKEQELINEWKARHETFERLPDSFKNNDYVLFPREYFSGSDIFIAFGNVPVDDIVAVEYQLIQNVQPVYGYASYTWDAVMTGNRYVMGNFRLNFKESFYIKSVLDKLIGREEYSERITPEDLSGSLTINQLADKIRNLNQDELQSLAKAYEDRLWGSEDSIDKRHETFMLNPFSTYDYINASSSWGSQYNRLLKDGFDIVISFGEEVYEMKSQRSERPATMKIINGVHLTGYKTVYEPTGNPIFEEYSFIARDVDDSTHYEVKEALPPIVKSSTPVNQQPFYYNNVMLEQ